MTRTIKKQKMDHSDEVKLWLYFAFIKLKVEIENTYFALEES